MLEHIQIQGGLEGPLGIGGGVGSVGGEGEGDGEEGMRTGKFGAWKQRQELVGEAGVLEVALQTMRMHHSSAPHLRLAGATE
mmetsp:Transcript_97202/g.142257  ORF Transcript_97202/g.142257 Transcript_97202/m.142257 type:complete len:82 (+) Transcript_97202:332-577(+)